jgi:hypothetical protein
MNGNNSNNLDKPKLTFPVVEQAYLISTIMLKYKKEDNALLPNRDLILKGGPHIVEMLIGKPLREPMSITILIMKSYESAFQTPESREIVQQEVLYRWILYQEYKIALQTLFQNHPSLTGPWKEQDYYDLLDYYIQYWNAKRINYFKKFIRKNRSSCKSPQSTPKISLRDRTTGSTTGSTTTTTGSIKRIRAQRKRFNLLNNNFLVHPKTHSKK